MSTQHLEHLPLAALTPYAANSRTHSCDQVRQIARSIEEFGFTNPVLIDGAGGIIAGHGRVQAAQLLGLATVPCLRLAHLTDAQKRAYIIADNQLALNAGWDESILAAELQALDGLEFDLGLIGFDAGELDRLLALGDDDAGPDDGAADDFPEVRPDAITQPGDVWLLGKHRLMCGDSTDKASVGQLMAGELASLVVTDPPYGVAYVGKTKDALTVENDDVSPERLSEMCRSWFDNVDAALAGGGYLLATVPSGPLHLIFADDWKKRGWLRQIMVWNKDSMVLGHSEYHYKHEPILFGWKQGGERLKNSDRTKTTVWDFPRPKASREHPTMKPVEMWRYAIENHSARSGLLYEPFSGSGTTIIASEQTGRRCYAMELSPHYVDVAVRRWQQFTGQTAILESTGQPFPTESP